jgi:hypothetical protein
MGVMHKPVEYRIGERRIAERGMPVVDWNL